ncbi:carboxylate-amine ligase [Cellulomonas hominis]
MRTIGVEEEFLLVGAEDGAPRAVASAVLRHASAQTPADGAGHEPGGDLEKEFTKEQVETSTRPCADLAALLDEIRAGRARADASARHAGARIAALATPPHDVEPTVIADRRARRIREVFGQTARDQLTCGCHVHVEVADRAEGVVVVDHLRPWTPILLALSANSPFWRGEDTSYESFRSQVWGRWPTAGPTTPFGDAATYDRLVDDLLASGTILDTGMVYFDARLSARYPTVEVRVPDVCLDPTDAVLQGALVRALAETAVRQSAQRGGRPLPPSEQVRTELVRVAAWRAARSGVRGDLLSAVTGRPAAAAVVVRELVDHVRPALRETGDELWVEEQVETLLARGNGAVQQRRWRHEGADDRELVARAVASTLA